ncbi:extracellular solute-binding protein [Roseivivax sediminis]|uniref:Iron(III) transport system substrate-binding protein n=1 Tax=Roseivivax sediminis TaxID=936889 RepID=A0A1I2AYJ1_9RHOB|nr:extracellular solute-binding protein [Roseivivax sediminis]SFE48829.1 iron(III) transport system substrate-binding protein [Roseivivax sediminis]
MTTRLITASALALAAALPATAQDGGELNLYSSRHYDTDERLYSDFEDETGITINRIEADADELIARMEAEAENSPADVFLTVDTSRLERAKNAGILQSVDSDVLEERIPSQYQDSDNQWFGFSLRGRIIFYDKNDLDNPPQTYMDLASDDYEGLICIRSSTNTYNQTLLASIIENEGEEAAREWAQGVVDNMARDPQGGDTDQLRAVASGECDIAVGNTYYFARALASDVDGVTENLDMFGWVFPNQETTGAHVNLSGGGIAANAPNRENAIAFLEYLASDSAQQYFAAGNNEYPVVEGVETTEAVDELGEFTADDVDLSAVAKHIPTAQQIFNEVGWE